VDVEAMKHDLGDLAERVTRLEKRKPAVDISGDIDFWGVTSSSENHLFGLSTDGRVVGTAGGAPIGGFHDLGILHEGAFTFAGTNETGPKWKGTIVVSDMMGPGAFGNQSSIAPSHSEVYGYQSDGEDVYVQDLSVKFDTKFLGLGTDIEAGRVAYKSSSNYVFQRPNPTSYYSNERWDDGLYRLDGAILGFNFGGAKLHIWGGDNSNLTSVDGIDLNPVVISNMRFPGDGSEGLVGTKGFSTSPANGTIGQMDKSLGGDLTFGLGGHGHVDLNFLVLEQEEKGPNNTTDNILNDGIGNRDTVFGGDAGFKFGRFNLSGGYHLSDLSDDATAVSSNDNAAWNAKVDYSAHHFNVWGGYRQIDSNYFAPGDWGKLGILQNPANIKGWQAGAYFDLTKALRFTATGEWDKGNENEANGGNVLNASPFGTNTNIAAYMARLDLRVNANLSLFGSYEDDKFSSLATGGWDGITLPAAGSANPEYGWTTFGLGYGLSSTAKFNIQYQFSNVGNEFLLGGPSRYTGGLLTSQLTVKF